MGNENLVKAITESRNFENGINRIHYSIHCSKDDAFSLLIEQVLRRIHFWNSNNANTLIKAFSDHSNPDFKNKQWAITYAAKDVVEDYYGHKTLLVENFDKSDELGQLAPINCKSSVSVENSLVNKVISLFPSDKTKLFVKSLLKYGKIATMDIFSMTDKKFEHALYDRIAYVKSNAQMFTEQLSGFDHQDTLDIFDYATKVYGMKYQGIVWKSFGLINDHQLKLDEYKLIDSIIDLQQELSKQFVPKEGQVSLYEATYLS